MIGAVLQNGETTLLIPFERIQNIAKQIGEQFHPSKVVLFGSYAWGTPTEESDIDLLVILPTIEEHPVKAASKIRFTLPRDVSIDVLVRDPEFVDYRVKEVDGFISHIMNAGKTLWESGHAV